MLLALAALLVAASPPKDRAEQIARALPHVQNAAANLAREIARIEDGKLRATVEAVVKNPGLPEGAWAVSHPREAAAALREAGLLEGELPPLAGADPFTAAPGGPCPDGHHAYPGGLIVHSAANALHAIALSRVYEQIYRVSLSADSLRAAAVWHDEAKALTLRWRDGGDCGREPVIAKTAAHHPIGIAAAIAHKLPAELVVIIASAHAPPSKENLEKICGWIRAGSILATGKPDAVACPDEKHPAPIEAFVNHYSDSDFALTGAASIAAVGSGGGWERFDALSKASELKLLQR